MKIIFTHHARYRMRDRRISEEMIKSAISNPEKAGVGYQNRLLAWKNFSEGQIKVVYTKEDDNYLIISVMWEK